MHCLTCGGARIEVGEAGRPSRCADCGGTNLAGVYATQHFKVLEQHSPVETTLKVIKRWECDEETVRRAFAKIHAVIDAI